MKLCENPTVCKIKKRLCKLSRYKLKEQYDVSVSLVNEDETDASETNTHRLSGSVECNLAKLLAILGMVALSLAAIKAICAFFFED